MTGNSKNADKGVIKSFISNKLLNGRDIDYGESLLLSGLVDSFGVVKLLMFLEEEFGITIPAQDVTITNMANIDAIAKYIDTTHQQST